MGEPRGGHRGRVAAVWALAALACAGAPAVVQAYTAQNGVAVTRFATGFDSLPGRGIGPVGLAFDTSQRLYVSALEHVYRFGAAGGPAGPARLSRGPISRLTTGLAFGRDGRLYAARYTADRLGDVVELDTADGRVVRTVAADVPCPTALATDPVSGDLFVSTVSCARVVARIADPAGAHPRPSVFLSGLAVDGLTFAPDGTLYMAHEPDESRATVSAVAGTNAAAPGTRHALAAVPHADGVALGAPARPDAPVPFVVVNRTDGVITKVDLRSTERPRTDLVTGGSRGDLIAVGADGCLYATQTDSVLRVTNADGTCRARAGVSSPVPPPLGHGLLPTTFTKPRPARRCSPRRAITIRVRVKGTRLRTARVYVAGRRVRTVRGRALRRPVRLRRLPGRRFTVTVRATTRGGRKVVRVTRYAACGARVLGRRTVRGR